MKKKYDEYLELEQNVQQNVRHRKKGMTNTWDMDKKLDAEKKYKKYVEGVQKVNKNLQLYCDIDFP